MLTVVCYFGGVNASFIYAIVAGIVTDVRATLHARCLAGAGAR
ncbi:MAG: hypothetical protein ABW007_01645 [Chitinophagaceae bacterium]